MDTQTIIMNCPVRLAFTKYRSTGLLCIFPSPSVCIVCIADLPFYGDHCMKTLNYSFTVKRMRNLDV